MLMSFLDSSSFRSKENLSVTSRIMNEVKSLNPSFETTDIRGIEL